MKNISVILLVLIFFSCGSGDDDGGNVNVSADNTAPTIPIINYPTNNLVCIGNTVNFRWNAATDAQGDLINYQLEVATDNEFTKNLRTSSTTVTSKELVLSKGQLYYWRIKAIDAKKAASAYSSVFNFYTEAVGVINHLPFAPALVGPELNSEQQNNSINLSWTAVDADQADVLSYDVYMGTTNPPLNKVANAIATKEYTANITNAGTYYWKVVVKDDKGGATIGKVWSFVKQ